jgi:predicted nucleic acid-binding protein
MIADTTFIIDIMRNDQSAITKAQEIERKNIPLIITAPTIFELSVGISLSQKPRQEKTKINEVLESLPFQPLDYESSQAAGQIYGDKQKTGDMIDPQDAMIAGISKTSGEKILTRNQKHFQDIPGVTTETY